MVGWIYGAAKFFEGSGVEDRREELFGGDVGGTGGSDENGVGSGAKYAASA